MLIIPESHDQVMPTDVGRHDESHSSREPAMSRPQIEVADVVRQHGAAFLARYGHTLSGVQRRALRAIELCYTPALGGAKNSANCGSKTTSREKAL